MQALCRFLLPNIRTKTNVYFYITNKDGMDKLPRPPAKFVILTNHLICLPSIFVRLSVESTACLLSLLC
ncbi:MAG: hypothetical protein NTX03_09070 [Bacteroidetes bacterium]|nr:hypothetical protein [Bacteroidota bacterium]